MKTPTANFEIIDIIENGKENSKMITNRALKKESVKKKQLFWEKIITVLSVLWVVFQLYFTTIGTIETIVFRAITAMLFLIFCFLIYPTSKKKLNKKIPSKLDFSLIAITISVFLYFEIGRASCRERV